MSLYRLDYVNARGEATGAVDGRHVAPGPNDPKVGPLLLPGDVLTRHMTTARAHAVTAARRAECDVAISRIVKGGQIKVALIVHPDGRASRPPKTRPPAGQECKAGSGQTCFCPNCRASRRGR